jgi:hypothetical protein
MQIFSQAITSISSSIPTGEHVESVPPGDADTEIIGASQNRVCSTVRENFFFN